MKRDRFRLATVLRVRQIQEDAVRGRLALARAASQRATFHSDAQTSRYRDGAGIAPKSGSTDSFIAKRVSVDRLVDAVVSAHGEVATAEVLVDERRVEWSVAAQRVAALDRLRDRHREAFVAAALAEDIFDADERTIARRHRLRAPDRASEPASESRLLHRPANPPPAVPAEFR